MRRNGIKTKILYKIYENKLPNIYFLLSDIFGGATLLRKKCKEYKNEVDKRKESNFELVIWDLIPDPGFY